MLGRYTVDELRTMLDKVNRRDELGQRQLEHLLRLGIERVPAWRGQPRSLRHERSAGGTKQ
jgi:hypothetical protein